MKFITVVLMMLTFNATAQDLGRKLSTVMSELGDNFKAVAMALQSNNINPKIIDQSQNIIKLIIESETITPSTITEMPASKQEQAKVKYVQELKEIEQNAVDLNTALVAGNLDLSKQIIAKMVLQKKQGHKDFN